MRWVLTWILVGLGALPARAQEREGWVVVVASVGSDASAVRRAASRAEEHLQGEGQAVLSGAALDERVGAGLSAPFRPITSQEAERLQTATDAALELVAGGADDQVRRSAAASLREVEENAAAIGRADEHARRVADLCLYAVRASHHAKQPDAARVQTTECLRLVPDAATVATPTNHPANVRAYLDAAQASLAQSGARLAVELSDGDAHCVVRVQGRRVTMPVTLAPGRYAVQVECEEEPGRVRRATVEAPSTTVAVDASLDAAMSNRAGLQLEYASEDAMRSRLGAHVQRIGAALGVANVLVVRTHSSEALMLERYAIDDGGARRVASVRVALSADARVPPAVDALIAGRSVDIGGATSEAGHGSASDGGHGSIVGPAILAGVGLVAIGIVAVAVATAGCEESYPDGSCARETQLAPGLGLAIGGAGLGAIIGGVLWFALD